MSYPTAKPINPRAVLDRMKKATGMFPDTQPVKLPAAVHRTALRRAKNKVARASRKGNR